ncbi:MAG: 50S ribosomal protein L29 [Candidatus Nanoarchaeia archaeon]
MAILKADDIKKMPAKDRADKLIELQKELIKLKTKRATGTAMQSPGKIKAIKRTIARIHTMAGSSASPIQKTTGGK